MTRKSLLFCLANTNRASRTAGEAEPAVARRAEEEHDLAMYYVYLLRLSDGSTYVGSTPDLAKRLEEHSMGKSISTGNKLPIELVASICLRSRLLARRFENYLKSGSGRAFAKRHFWSADPMELEEQKTLEDTRPTKLA